MSGICSLDDCDRLHYARGLCQLHYNQFSKSGDLPSRTVRPTETERFWSMVQITGADDCWLWTGKFRNSGYGIFSGCRRVLAHRYSWELANGRSIPDGLEILHSCDNRPCVNPAHLSVGTRSENARDMWLKGRKDMAILHRAQRLGEYRSRRIEVAEFAATGMTPSEIAHAAGIDRYTVYNDLRALRRIGNAAAENVRRDRAQSVALERYRAHQGVEIQDRRARVQELAATGMTREEIARNLGVSNSTVGRDMRGVKQNLWAPRRARIQELTEAGVSSVDIARILSISRAIVRSDLRALGIRGVPYVHAGPPGRALRRARVQELTIAGMTQREIACALGIDRATACRDQQAIRKAQQETF